MDIRSILIQNQQDNELQKLFLTATIRKKDLHNLVVDCRSKLSIYQQMMQEKQALISQQEQLRQKYDNLVPGLFELIQKQYQEQKCHTQHQSQQKNEIIHKRSHPQRHTNHYSQGTKHIRKVQKRRK